MLIIGSIHWEQLCIICLMDIVFTLQKSSSVAVLLLTDKKSGIQGRYVTCLDLEPWCVLF